MPSNIDDRIVNMQFNNKRFESGVADTMKTLDQFQTKLNNLDGGKGFEELEKAANKIDLSSVGKGLTSIENGVTTVADKFSAWGIAAKRVIENISDDAYRLGKQFVSSLSIDQIKAGWDKYGSMAQSVGTIMSATGLDIEAVTEQMERLNWYTDETSYNYTDMADNIAKFTSQEIPLEKATEAMMGIANWSALAGQNAATASRAMYNVSQAMGIGYMGLADWKSIELANMGTAQFKQHVIDVAIEMGKLKKVTTDTGESFAALDEKAKLEDAITVANFRESLKEKWFDSEVMERVFQDYGKFATKLNETINELNEADETLGINATDILGILEEYDENKSLDKLNQRLRGTKTSAQDVTKYLDILSSKTYELSRKAFAAAQEYKTFSDAIDATKDAVSTQWLNTFSYIFGNYEEAKELWTAFGGTLYDLFATAGEERNAVLREWKALGGRDTLVSAILEALETLDNVVFAIKDGFEKIFPSIDAKKLKEITESFKKFIDGIYISEDDTEKLEKISSIVSHLAGAAKTVFSSLGAILSTISSAIKETFLDGINLDTLDKTAEKIEEFVKNLAISKEDLEGFKDAISGVFKAIKRISPIFVKAGGAIATILVKMGEAIGGFITEALKFTGDAINGILDFFDRIKNNEKLAESLERLHDAFKKLFDVIKDNASKVNEKLSGFFEALGLSDGANTLLGKLADTIANLIIIVADFISNGVEKLTAFLENTDIIEEAIELWDKFTEAIKNAYEKVSDFLAPAIDTVSGSLKSAYESAKEYLPAAFDWLSEKLEGAYNSVTEFLQPATDKIKEFFGSFKEYAGKIDISSLGINFEGGIWSGLSSFFDKVKNEWIPLIWGFVQKKYPKVVELFETVKNWLVGFFKSENKFQKIKELIGGISTAIVDFSKNAFEKLKSVWAWLKEQFSNLGPAGVTLAIFAGGLLAVLVGLLNVFDKLTGPVGKVLGAVEGFLTAGKGLLKAAKINQIAAALNTLATSVKTLATAFLILTVSMKVLDSLEHAGRAIGLMAGLAVGIIGLVAAFRYLGTVKDKKGDIKAITAFGDTTKLLIGMAISLLAFASVAKKVSDISADKWWEGFKRTIAMLGAIIIALRLATPKNGSRSAIKGALSILALTVAVDLLVKSITKMRANNLDDALSKILLISAVAVALGTLGKIFRTRESEIGGGKYKVKDGVGLLGVAAVMIAFIVTLRELTKLNFSEVEVLPVLLAIGLVLGSLAAILVITKKLGGEEAGKNLSLVGMSLLAFAASVAVLGYALSKFKAADTKSILTMAGVFGAITLAMAVLIKATKLSKADKSGGPGAALEIAALAASLTVLAVTIGLLSLIKPEKLIAPTLVVIALIGMLAVLVKESSKLKKDSFKAIIAIGIIVAILAAIIGVISAIGTEKLGPATAVVGGIVAFLALLMYTMAKIPKNAQGQLNAVIKGIVALILTAAAILGASMIITEAVKEVKDANLNESDYKIFAVIAGVLIAVAGVITYIGKSLKGNSFGQTLSALANTVIPVIAAMILLQVIALAVGSIASEISGASVSKESFTALASMALMVAILAAVITVAAKNISGASISLSDLAKVGVILVASAGMVMAIVWMTKFMADTLKGVKLPKKEEMIAVGGMALVVGLVSVITAWTAKVLKGAHLGPQEVGTAIELLFFSTVLLLAVAAVGKVISSLMDGYTPPEDMLSKIESIGLVAAAVVAIAAAIALLAKVMSSMKVDIDDLVESFGALGLGTAVLIAAAAMTTLINNVLLAAPIDISQFTSKILAVGEAMLAIGLATMMIIGISALKLDPSNLMDALEGIVYGVVVLAIAGALSFILNALFNQHPVDINKFTANMLAIGEVMVAVGLAVGMVLGIGALTGGNPGTAALIAVSGLVAVAIIVVGVGLLAAIIGEVAKLCGGTSALGQLLNDGFDILDIVIEGIARLAKTFVKGAIDATLGSLIASIGTSLGEFWENGKPFFDGMAEDGGKIGSAMVSLGAGLAAFVGAEILDGLGKMFGLTGNFDRIKDIFSNMGEGLMAFHDKIGNDFNLLKLKIGVDGLKELCTAMSMVPFTGGIFEWITGKQDFDGYAHAMDRLGIGIRWFASHTRSIDKEQITTATDSLKVLTELNNLVPKTGGTLQKFFGESGIGKFGESLPQLGEGLSGFVEKIAGNTYDDVDAAVASLKIIAELNNLVPKTGGAWQDIVGNKDLSLFAENLPKLGTGIYNFASSIASAYGNLGQNGSEKVASAIGWIGQLVGFFNSLDDTGGAWGFLAGDQSFEPLASGLTLLGESFHTFATKISTIKDDDIKKATKFGSDIIALVARMALLDLSVELQDFNDALSQFSEGVKYYVDKVSCFTEDELNNGIAFAEKFINLSKNTDFSGVLSFASAFSSLAQVSVDLFIETFETAWDDVKDAGSKFMQKCYEGMRFVLTDANLGIKLVAEDVADGFIEGLDDRKGTSTATENSAMRAGWQLSKAARNGMDKGASKSSAKTLGIDIGQGLIDGLDEKKSTVLDKAQEIGEEVIRRFRAATTYLSASKAVGEDIAQGLLNGLSSKQEDIYTKAFEIGAGIIRNLRTSTKTESPSKEAMAVGQFIDIGLAKGMDMYTTVVENSAETLGDDTIEAMKNSISRINDYINSDMNLDPTIRPVLDLSGLQSGSSQAARLLNLGPMTVGADRIALTTQMAEHLAASEGTQNGTVNGGLIANILDHIDMLSNDIQQMQLVMDSGAVVGSIAGQMDSALGQMAVYRGRGN